MSASPADSLRAAPGKTPRSAAVTALPGRGEKDAGLMARVRATGDRAAFGELARHYGPRLKAWLMKRGEGAETAEDVVQDVLIAAWRKAALFDPEKASFSTWLFRLTRNRWIDHKRKHGRMRPTAPDRTWLERWQRLERDRQGAARRDVRLCNRPALDEPGPGGLLHGIRKIRRGTAERRGYGIEESIVKP